MHTIGRANCRDISASSKSGFLVLRTGVGSWWRLAPRAVTCAADFSGGVRAEVLGLKCLEAWFPGVNI